MSNNLVEQLRNFGKCDLKHAAWGKFAADEIERLRSLLSARSDTLELRWQDCERLEAEVERLRAEVRALQIGHGLDPDKLAGEDTP